MSNTKLNLIILGLVLSPVWVGLLASIGQPPTSVSGLGVVGGAVLGTPFIAVVGLVISFFTRNSINPNKASVIGYAIPAFVVCAYELFAMLA